MNLTLGYSHPVVYDLPEGISADLLKQTDIILKGIDKQLVGQVAAEIRSFRKVRKFIRFFNKAGLRPLLAS